MSSFDDAVTALFREQFESLFRYLDRLGGDPDLASDLAQEAFVKLYERGTMPDTPRAWLATVATNLLRDARRTATRRDALVARAVLLADAPEVPAVDTRLVAEETRAQIRAALETLPARDRQLLLLRHEGYSYRELALIVGVGETGVGTLLLRAGRALRAALTREIDAADITSH